MIKDISQFDDVLWNVFYKYYLETLMNENKPNTIEKHNFIERYKRTINNIHINYEVIFSDKFVVGIIEKQYLNLGEKEEVLAVDINIAKLKKLIKVECLLKTYLEELKLSGHKIRIEAKEEILISLLKDLNFENTNQVINFKLNFKELKLTRLKNLLSNSIEPFDLIITSSPSNIDLEQSAKLSTLLLNEMKRENDEQIFKETSENLAQYVVNCKKNKRQLILVYLKKNGALIGQTGIEISSNKIVASQLLTGIKKEYRRKGLSSFIKAKLYLHLKTNFSEIETIYTDCFAENNPMILANEKFGFQKDFIVSEMFYNPSKHKN